MTTTPIALPRNSPDGRLVKDMDFDGPVPAGVFEFYDGPGPDAGLLFGCPCGCGDMRTVAFRTHNERRPSWNWDGNREGPTLTPSILIYQMDAAGNIVGEHWHGFLTAGQWRSC